MDRRTNYKPFDALALEDHSFEATPEERGRYKKLWHTSLNKEGTNGPNRQRPDFRGIFNRTKNLLKVPVKGIVQCILKIKQDVTVNILKVSRRTTTRLILELQTNKFVFSRALGAARRLEVESKLGFLAIFNLDWTVKFYVCWEAF